MGHEPQGLQNRLWEAHLGQVLQGIGRVLHHIVEQSHNGALFVRHLFRQVEGVEHIGQSALVGLVLMGSKAQLHGLLGQIGINHKDYPFCKYSRISAALVSGFTLGMTFSITPFSSMT